MIPSPPSIWYSNLFRLPSGRSGPLRRTWNYFEAVESLVRPRKQRAGKPELTGTKCHDPEIYSRQAYSDMVDPRCMADSPRTDTGSGTSIASAARQRALLDSN